MDHVGTLLAIIQVSCHVCGMWIEMAYRRVLQQYAESCHVCGMWIEIVRCKRSAASSEVMPRMWHVD